MTAPFNFNSALSNSDRGCQYASLGYQQLLAEHGIIASMSRSENCWDNALAESFRHSQTGAGVSNPVEQPGPGPAAKSLNTSNCSTTAAGAILEAQLEKTRDFERTAGVDCARHGDRTVLTQRAQTRAKTTSTNVFSIVQLPPFLLRSIG